MIQEKKYKSIIESSKDCGRYIYDDKKKTIMINEMDSLYLLMIKKKIPTWLFSIRLIYQQLDDSRKISNVF